MPEAAFKTNEKMEVFPVKSINKGIFLNILIHFYLILSLSGEALAETYHFSEERYETWSLGIIHTEHKHKVVNEKLNKKLKAGFIHFSESTTPWEITICTDNDARNKPDTGHEYIESNSFVVKTAVSKDYVLTTYAPNRIKSGYIEIDAVAINTCSYMKVGGITYYLKDAEPAKGQATESPAKSMMLNARIKIVDTPVDEYGSSNYPTSKGENFDPLTRDPWSDYNDDHQDRKPFPFLPMGDKQINLNIMLGMMGTVFGADVVLQWFNNWRNFFHARLFSGDAEAEVTNRLTDLFVNIYSIITGNHHQLQEKKNNGEGEATVKKDHPEIVYIMMKTGEIRPFVRIISHNTDGKELVNIIPAYLSVWDNEESVYKEISTESIRKMVNIFNPKSCGHSSPEMDKTVIFLLMTLAKNIYWLTDLTGVDPIPFTVKDLDNYAAHVDNSKEAAEFTLSENSYSKYMQNLKIFLKNRKEFEIQGDGQCFFRALGKAIYKRAISDDEVRNLRRKLANFLTNVLIEPVDTSDERILRQRDRDHLQNLQRNLQNQNTWGEMELLPLAAELFEEEIYFVTPDHTGEVHFTRANPDGSVSEIDRSQISNTPIIIYHNGVNHWGVSRIEGEPTDVGGDSPEQGTSTTRATAVSSDSSTSNTHHKNGDHNSKERKGGNGGDSPDPRKPGDSLTGHYVVETLLQRLDEIREVDKELADHIQTMYTKTPEGLRNHLQVYVNQLANLLIFYREDPEQVDREQVALDLKWILTQNMETVKTINAYLLKERASSEDEDLETTLKILVLQNLISDHIPIRGARALMIFFHEKTPYEDDTSVDEDIDTDTVKSNKELIKDLVDYLHSRKSETSDITQFRPTVPTDLLKFDLKALLKVSTESTADHTVEVELSNSDQPSTFSLLEGTCEAIDRLFRLSDQILNPVVKKVKKHFVIEENTTRLEREEMEAIFYSQTLQLLLRKAYLKGIVSDLTENADSASPTQVNLPTLDRSLTTLDTSGKLETLAQVSMYLVDLSKVVAKIPKTLKEKLKPAYPDLKDDTAHRYSKMVPISDFNNQMEKNFNELYFTMKCESAECIPLSIERSYTAILLSIINQGLEELVSPDYHKLLKTQIRQSITALLWNKSWTTTGNMDNSLFHLLTITIKLKEALLLNKSFFTTSKLPMQLKFAKGLAVKEQFSKALFLEKPGTPQVPFLDHAERKLETFKHIAETEYKSTSEKDFEYFKQTMNLENDDECINISPWESKFVEAVLLQHATESKSTPRKKTSLDKLLTRDLKSPSFLGSLFYNLGSAFKDRVCTKPFHQASHDFKTTFTHQTLDHITPKLWERGATWIFTGNHMHEPHARHDSNGVLQHAVPFIDKALKNPENLQNWYTLINLVLGEIQNNLKNPIESQPLVSRFFDQITTSLETNPETNPETRRAISPEIVVKEFQTFTEDKRISFLDLMKRKSKSIERDSYYIFEIVYEACIIFNEDTCDAVDSKLKDQLSEEYKKSEEIITDNTAQTDTVPDDTTDQQAVRVQQAVSFQPEMLVFLKYFAYSLLKNITTDNFRFQVTPDGNSIQLMAEILALLNIPVTDKNGQLPRLFEILDISKEVMTTVESYFIRLSSEHYRQIELLVGEHFLHISEETEELKPETRHTIETLREDNDFTAFFRELKNFWGRQAKEHDGSYPRTSDEFIDTLMKDIHTLTQELEVTKQALQRSLAPQSSGLSDSYEHLTSVVTVQPESIIHTSIELEEPLTQVLSDSDHEDARGQLLPEHVQQELTSLSPEQTEKNHQQTEKMIHSGRFIHQYLEQLKAFQQNSQHEATATDEQKQASRTKWVKTMEWLESNEKSISIGYLCSSITAIWYRAFGDTLPSGNNYSSGGRAPFATVIIDNKFAIDFMLLGLSFVSVATQVSQAAGWNKDVSNKIEMNLNTRHFPFSVSELPPYFIDHFLLYYLNNQDTEHPRTLDESIKLNPYKVFTNFKDTCMDLLSMLCCRSSPLTECCQCPGPLNYIGRAVSTGNRMICRDTIRGGVEKLLHDYIQKIKNRRTSSLVRLIGENTPKSINNSWGVSIYQQLVAIAIHGVDGLIALTEISDMALMQQAEQVLVSSANAAERLFDDKPLSQYDMDRIVKMFGTSLLERLTTQDPLHLPDYDRNQRIAKALRGLATALQAAATAVTAYDIYYFLVKPLTMLDGVADGSCQSSTAEKMPGAGKDGLECFLGKFADARSSDPWFRFFSVASSKTGANVAWFIDTLAASIENGHTSYDEVMLGTLIAGIMKNTILGPTERALQTSPDITPNTIGDVVGQFDTYLKEAVESTVQRMAPKAPLALSRVGRAMVMKAMRQQQGDLARVHTALEEELRHLSENVGFGAMNAGAEMRYMLAKEELAKTDPGSSTSFQDFKEKAMKQVTKSLPTLHSGGLKMDPKHVQPYEQLKELVQHFLDDTDNGKPLVPAILNLITGLKPLDRAVVDIYIQQVMLAKKSESLSQESSHSDQEDTFWSETVRMYQIKKEEDKIKRVPILNPDR